MPAVVTRSGISFRFSRTHLTAICLVLEHNRHSLYQVRRTIFALSAGVLRNLYEPLALSTAECHERSLPRRPEGKRIPNVRARPCRQPIGYTLGGMPQVSCPVLGRSRLSDAPRPRTRGTCFAPSCLPGGKLGAWLA